MVPLKWRLCFIFALRCFCSVLDLASFVTSSVDGLSFCASNSKKVILLSGERSEKSCCIFRRDRGEEALARSVKEGEAQYDALFFSELLKNRLRFPARREEHHKKCWHGSILLVRLRLLPRQASFLEWDSPKVLAFFLSVDSILEAQSGPNSRFLSNWQILSGFVGVNFFFECSKEKSSRLLRKNSSFGGKGQKEWNSNSLGKHPRVGQPA